jgi:hypothetical protein
MTRGSLNLTVGFLFLGLGYGQTVHPVDRVSAVPDDSRTVTLTGNHHPLARPENEVGVAPPSHRMDKMILVLESSDEQKKALEALVAAQQDPASAQYQKWLTPEQFAAQFGVSQNDVDQVTAWLTSHGFTIDEIPAGQRTVVFSGTAQMVENAFHTQIRQYNVNGAVHYANASDPQIPAALAAVVKGTSTLHDFARKGMSTPSKQLAQATPDFNSGWSYYLAPADFATIYNLNPLYAAGTNGAGASIAVVGRTNINLSDVQTFRSYFGLPVNNPQIILNGPNPGITADQDEAMLDVEWAGAIGAGATVKFVVSESTNTTDGVDLSTQYIVANNIASIVTSSYGSCEAAMGSAELAFYSNLWQQAAAQGISAMVAAGDSGAAGCDLPSETVATDGRAVNGLCSSIYSVCMGGTEFDDNPNYTTYWSSSMNPTTKGSALSYIPESVWNQSGAVVGDSGLWATGGGASEVYLKPSWQTGPGVPVDGMRDVPDVALASSTHDGFLVVMNGNLYAIGGTSAAAPSFAGIMALVNQKYGAQGNPNPTLYQLAALETNHGTSHSYFHDITTGVNTVPGVQGYYAFTGYDQSSGLGSVNANDLVNYWRDAVVSATPTMSAAMSAGSLTVRQGGSGTSTATVSIGGGFSNAVTLGVSGVPAGVTASFASTNLAAPGSGSSVLTITAGASALPGTSTITVTANGGGLSSTASVSVTVVPAFTLLTSSAVSVQPGASTTLILSSGIASGFNGSISLSASSPSGLTVGFAPPAIAAPGAGNSTLTVSAASSMTPGVYPISITGTNGSLTAKASFNVTVAASSFTLNASPSSINAAPGGSASSSISLTPANGFSGSVALSTGSLPAGITVQFSSTSITGSAGANMTATVASTVAAGSYPISVIGTGGGVSPAPTATVTLVVAASAGSFTLTALAGSAGVLPSGNAFVPIETSVKGGFSGPLTLSATGLPPGVTASFAPQTIANAAGGASALWLSAQSSVQVGTSLITIVATSSTGATSTATVYLTVY